VSPGARPTITSRRDQLGSTAILWLMAALTLVPLAVIVITALTPSSELVGGVQIPSHLTLSNFTDAWTNGGLRSHLTVSAVVTGTTVAICTVGSVLAGYALGTLRTPMRGPLAACFILGIVVPYEALVIPLYYQLRSLGLTDTDWSLILPQSALSLAFGVYWMRGFFRNVPRSYIEAARVEGASSWQLLWELLPLARPAIATLVILTFMWNWNEFLLPAVMISDEAHATAPLALANFQGRFDVNVAELTAAAVIVALPIVVLYVGLQRRFLDGVVRGGGTR
jgi:raffinose/stachyose/melibiose transport system permease protein